MITTAVAAVLALQLLGGSSPSNAPADAYLDDAARTLVERARERRNTVEGRIEQYRTLSRTRFTVGLRALRRDRTFYRCEAASRVEWNRGDTIRVELLGAREVAPMFTAEVQAGDGECGGSSFDPAGDRLAAALGGGMALEDSSFLRHPLANGSEAHYRFRSGGTTAMRLADGTMIRLRELVVIPRRSEPFLVSGSLWLEDRSHAVVRAVLRMARPFDFHRDAANIPDDDTSDSGFDDDDDDEDDIPRVLGPIRADLRYMTIEYGLWDQQWWLPRLIAFEGEAEIGRLLAIPIRAERTYGEYEVRAVPPGEPMPPLPVMAADSVCGDMDRGDDEDDQEEAVDGEDGEGEPERSINIGPRGVEYEDRRSCNCSDGRCQVTVTRVTMDSTALMNSEYLPPSIYSDEGSLITEREMEELLAIAESLRKPPWQLAPITWRAGFQGLDLLRYNRVEGLSLGAAANLELGRATVDATVRLGVADLAPNFELGAWRESAISRQRVAVYRRLDAVGPAPASMGLGGSLTALLFGRDDGDYYRAWGAEVTRAPAGGRDGLSWRLFGEVQRAAAKHTDFSFANSLGGSAFRPNIEADRAEQVGLEATLAGTRGANPLGWRGGAEASLLGSTGTFSFAQPRLTLRSAAPFPFGLLGALEVSGGATWGEAPIQSLYYLGGGRTVRGYDGNAARGETFWTARGEVATAFPGARVVLFSDAGWAGDADAFTADPLLLSVGAGVSFLDGLVRLDVARPLREVPGSGDFRVELQIDAGL